MDKQETGEERTWPCNVRDTIGLQHTVKQAVNVQKVLAMLARAPHHEVRQLGGVCN